MMIREIREIREYVAALAMEFDFHLVVIYILTAFVGYNVLANQALGGLRMTKDIELFLMKTALTDSPILDHFTILA